MKCGDNHSTNECEKPNTTPPKCANCCKEHLSVNKKCEKNFNYPQFRKNKEEKLEAQPVKKESSWAWKSQEKQESQKAENEQNQTIGGMFADYLKKNPTTEEQMKFFEKTEKLIELFKSIS